MPMPVRDLRRAMNRAAILDAIRTADMIPRIEIARTTGLSQALVTGLTAEMIREGLIVERRTGESEGGRRPILLALNPDGAYVVGVNLAIGEISVAIVNFTATVVADLVQPLEDHWHSVEEITDLVVRAVQTCIWEANFSKEQISGVGIGIPGPIDYPSGLIRFLPNYGWENVNLKLMIEKRLNHPTFTDNSSNTLTMAEQWFGKGKGINNFLVVTIENGVGMGGVIHGRLFRGQSGIAGEFGHLTLDPNGPPCRCGKNGCVEAYAGNNSIVRFARQAAASGYWQPPKPETITFERVVEAARAEAGPPREILARAGSMLGLGLAHLINLYNPSRIIIAGRGVKAGPLLFDTMYETVGHHVSAKFGRMDTEIVIRSWTDKDWARAAGALVLQELYQSPVTAVAPR